MEPNWLDGIIGRNSNSKNHEQSELCEVKKILDDRVEDGVRKFLIQWVGYSESQNSWVDEGDLNCAQILKEYLEDKKIKHDLHYVISEKTDEQVVGVTKQENKLYFKLQKGDKIILVSNEKMKKHHPKALFDYYESRIVFTEKRIIYDIKHQPNFGP